MLPGNLIHNVVDVRVRHQDRLASVRRTSPIAGLGCRSDSPDVTVGPETRDFLPYARVIATMNCRGADQTSRR
jgi:hypothetical protein